MRKRVRTPEFGHLVDRVITDQKLDKSLVAAKADIHITTLYRAIDGAGLSKGSVIALIGSINRLAGRDVIEAAEGMKLAGFEYGEILDAKHLVGQTADEIIPQIIDRTVRLPVEIQRDVLAMVNALYDRHKI